MKRRLVWIPAVLLIGFLLGGITYYLLSKTTSSYMSFAPRVPKQMEETSRAFSEIVRAVSPAVVNISSTKVIKKQPTPFDEFFDFLYPFPDGRGKRWKEQSLGSGVIVSPDGYIVTNNHVVEQADEIKVILIDKKSFKAKVVGSDPKTDIAIIKIDAKGLPVLPWGDSERLQVGEFVLAIGNPFGLSHTVTMGIISAVGRADVGITDYENFIQTDAAINPGNSGGPLVNIKGELIGINTAIFSKTGGYQGIGFTVPSNMVRIVMDQLIKQGKVTRGWLGITIQELTPEIAQKFGLKQSEGALVSDVAKGSPAHRAGMARGDIILEFNGKKVRDVATLRNMVAQSKVGSQVEIKVLRRDREITLKANIMELPTEMGDVVPSSSNSMDMSDSALSGITVMDINAAIAKQLGIDRDEKGVVIVKVEHGSSAEDAGLRKGDVVQEIDRQRINGLNDFNKATSKIRTEDTVLLFVNR
ncbi:MAG: DegQ family serine endoprotease, partial [Nitrospiraceae bacterium]|nr:DegQ family serine endoprotease [Nitrospiraceae bacterium]